MTSKTKAGLGAAVFAAVLVAWAPAARCQAQSQDQNPPQQPATGGQQETDSVAEAARKAKAGKPKADTKKVYTTDDFPSSRGGGASTSSDKDASGKDNGTDAANKALGRAGGATGGNMSAGGTSAKDEAYWRGRAQKLRDEMAQVDSEIDKLKDDMKKGGGAGFNVQSGLTSNTVYFDDRNAQLKKLEQKKAEIQKQMDDLEEEARKADVPSSWVR